MKDYDAELHNARFVGGRWWGTIMNDTKRRFEDVTYVRTSSITAPITKDSIAQTRNTRYLIVNPIFEE